jgi:hypothetical protein
MNLYEKEHFLLNLGTLCPNIDRVCAEYLTGLLAEVKKEKKERARETNEERYNCRLMRSVI